MQRDPRRPVTTTICRTLRRTLIVKISTTTKKTLSVTTPRYELAQQLQPQPPEDSLGGTTVSHEIQVEIEDEDLEAQEASGAAEQRVMLGLDQAQVVGGGQQVTLETELSEQPLIQTEGKCR